MPKNDWNEYKKLVMNEMKENGKRFDHINTTLTDLQVQLSALKVKAAVAGGIAGIVGTGLVTAVLTAFK